MIQKRGKQVIQHELVWGKPKALKMHTHAHVGYTHSCVIHMKNTKRDWERTKWWWWRWKNKKLLFFFMILDSEKSIAECDK